MVDISEQVTAEIHRFMGRTVAESITYQVQIQVMGEQIQALEAQIKVLKKPRENETTYPEQPGDIGQAEHIAVPPSKRAPERKLNGA